MTSMNPDEQSRTDEPLSDLEEGDTLVWDGHVERVSDSKDGVIVTEVVYQSESALLEAATAFGATYVPADSE